MYSYSSSVALLVVANMIAVEVDLLRGINGPATATQTCVVFVNEFHNPF